MLAIQPRIPIFLTAALGVWFAGTLSADDNAMHVKSDSALQPLPPVEWRGTAGDTSAWKDSRSKLISDRSVVAPQEMETVDDPIFASGPVRRVSGTSQHAVSPLVVPLGSSLYEVPETVYASTDLSEAPLAGLQRSRPRTLQPLYKVPNETVPHHWVSAESLLWWVNGVDVPVVASTSPQGTPGLQAAVPGQPGTGILWGGGDLFDLPRGGFRVRGGRWHEEDDGSGWQAEFLMLASAGHNLYAASEGNPIIGRPFVNEATGFSDAQLVAFPGLSSGVLQFNAETRMYSASIAYWSELVVENEAECGEDSHAVHSPGCPQYNRANVFGIRIGPRFIHHDDTVLYDESLRSTVTGNQFRIFDSFKTENSFLGGELGLRGRHQQGRLSVDLGVNLAVGMTRQELDVSGLTELRSGAGTSVSNGGFYAQPTNSGSWDETEFSLVPSMEVALGYDMGKGWRFSVGYDLMYWTNVLRAAEQIDTTVHPDQFPPAVMPNSATRPGVLLNESDYFAHGLSFAIERRW